MIVALILNMMFFSVVATGFEHLSVTVYSHICTWCEFVSTRQRLILNAFLFVLSDEFSLFLQLLMMFIWCTVCPVYWRVLASRNYFNPATFCGCLNEVKDCCWLLSNICVSRSFFFVNKLARQFSRLTCFI